MDRFPLQAVIAGEYGVADAQQTSYSIPWIRFMTIVYVGSDSQPRDGMLDLGAPLSVIPQLLWSGISNEISWLTPPAGASLPSFLTTVSGYVGGEVPCKLGIIPLSLMNLRPRRRLPPVPVIAKFALDGEALTPRVILGVGRGILDHWRLVVEPPGPQAWLEEPSP